MGEKLKRVIYNPRIFCELLEETNELYLELQPQISSFDEEYAAVTSILEVKDEILEHYQVKEFTLRLCYTMLEGRSEISSNILDHGIVLHDEYSSARKI